MNVVILDARTPEAYAAGHLDGALHADLETQLSAPADPARGGRHPLPPLDRWLRQVAEWGITPDSRVIVYDDQQGANAAARVWWMLKAIGHGNVEVLTDWRNATRNADTRNADTRNADTRSAGILPAAPPASSRPVSHWQLPTATMRQVDTLRTNPSWRVLDVRATPRFRGETEPIDPVAGHIPGAINLPFAENLDAHGRFKPAHELRALYEQLLGDVPPERLIVHCGSGVTACHTLLALDQAGLPGAALYVGSWGEWCRNDMPIGRS